MKNSRRLGDFSGTGYSKGRNKFWQGLWHLCSYAIFQKYWLPLSVRPKILRFFGAQIGTNVKIREGVAIHWPWKLRVGDNSWIGRGAYILNLEHVTIEDNVCISQFAFICTGSHDVSSISFEYANAPITIQSSVWVCASAFILPGSLIPEGSVVPANSTFPSRKRRDF